jgi:serine/threonine-protein kinase RsbW
MDLWRNPMCAELGVEDANSTGRRFRHSLEPGSWSLSSLDQLPGLLDEVIGVMESAGYGTADRFAVRLALEEAVVNAVKHGHDYDPGKQVRIWWILGASSVSFVVHDEGPGFDVSQVPDPRRPENLERPAGRGLFLIGAFMSWLRFNRRGNCLAMCRRRSNGKY